MEDMRREEFEKLVCFTEYVYAFLAAVYNNLSLIFAASTAIPPVILMLLRGG